MSDDKRKQLLNALLNLEPGIEETYSALANMAWDCPMELVTLRAQHVASVLGRFIDGKIDSECVERWANAIESREDVAFDSAQEESLRHILFELANPELSQPLSRQTATEFLEALNRR